MEWLLLSATDKDYKTPQFLKCTHRKDLSWFLLDLMQMTTKNQRFPSQCMPGSLESNYSITFLNMFLVVS